MVLWGGKMKGICEAIRKNVCNGDLPVGIVKSYRCKHADEHNTDYKCEELRFCSKALRYVKCIEVD